jgi:glucose/arabinose dehydrogenase
MRTLACALLLLAACSDPKNGPRDAPPNGDGQNGDGATIDAPACEPAPLAACATPVSGSRVTLRRIMPNVPGAPLLAVSPKNDPRLFIVERSGLIYVYENEVRRATPFLDVSSSIAAGGEQGLLGLAFHPSYGCNGEFFIYYTTNTANIVSRCTVSAADSNVANPACTPILSIPDSRSNHNGGMMEFGPDGYLYIGTGDGGGGGDPDRNGQSLTNGSPQANSIALLGKILRIDVNTKAPGKEYGIPATNPFAASGGAPEIFVIGLRNPWRWSFDKSTGDLWIGDVGQTLIEELDVLRPGQQAGKNLGWSMYEGNSCFRAPCSMTGMTFPVDTRTHADGWVSIIAGETYRGTCYPDLAGWHFYTDYQSAAAGLKKARLMANDALEIVDVPVTLPDGVVSIHADARGEIYLTTEAGGLYHLEAAP